MEKIVKCKSIWRASLPMYDGGLTSRKRCPADKLPFLVNKSLMNAKDHFKYEEF